MHNVYINGRQYNTLTLPGFDSYDGYEAKIITGAHTPSGQAVAILVDGTWQFVRPVGEAQHRHGE